MVAPMAEHVPDVDARIAYVEGDAVPPPAPVALSSRRGAPALAWASDGGAGGLGARDPLGSTASKLVDGIDRGAGGVGGPTWGDPKSSKAVVGPKGHDLGAVRKSRQRLGGEDEVGRDLCRTSVAPEGASVNAMDLSPSSERLDGVDQAITEEVSKGRTAVGGPKLQRGAHGTEGQREKPGLRGKAMLAVPGSGASLEENVDGELEEGGAGPLLLILSLAL